MAAKKRNINKMDKLNEKLESLERGLKWTAPRYWGAYNANTHIGKFLRVIQVMATLFALVLVISPNIISIFGLAWVGLLVSLVVFLFLLLEFVFFRPRILNTLDLKPDKIHSELKHDYPVVQRIQIPRKTRIKKWGIFYETKQKAVHDLKDVLFSGDKLRLYCFVKIFLRTLVLLVWFSMIIQFVDICSGYELLQLPTDVARSSVEHLYQSFSLFSSVSSISVLTSTPVGIGILLGQIVIYFTVLVVIIGRFSEYLSMYTSQIENFAHASILKNLDL